MAASAAKWIARDRGAFEVGEPIRRPFRSTGQDDERTVVTAPLAEFLTEADFLALMAFRWTLRN